MIFLRPWLLLLLLVLIPLYYLTKETNKINSWKKYINKDFLPFVLTEKTSKQKKAHTFLKIALLWTFLTISLAGPAFQKIPQESTRPFEGTVLIADLNSVNQNTLTQLKLKLLQTIKLLENEKIGLVLFDAKGYTALPLTDDREILSEMISVLNTDILPLEGQNLENALKKADELFKNNDLKTGRILLFTGGILDSKKAIKFAKKLPYKIGVLGIGSETAKTPLLNKNGSFKRDINNQPILLSLNKKELSQLGNYTLQTINDSDIKKLISETKTLSLPLNNLPTDNFFKVDEYKDLGIYLLVCLMPFIALLFRKGIFITCLLFLFSSPSHADLWQREDQKIYNSTKQGILDYREKKYLDALTRFQKDTSAIGLYNQGNAHAQLGNISEAIELYQKALQKDPNLKEAAINKKKLEEKINKYKKNTEDNTSENNQTNKEESQQENSASQNNQTNTGEPQQGNSASQNNQTNKEESQQENSASQNNQTNKEESQQENSASQNNQTNTEESQQGNSVSQNNNKPKENNLNLANNEEKDEKNNDTKHIKNKTQNSESSTDSENAKQEDLQQNTSKISSDNNQENEKQLDQNTQEIFNRLKKDPSRLLKFRLNMQSQRG